MGALAFAPLQVAPAGGGGVMDGGGGHTLRGRGGAGPGWGQGGWDSGPGAVFAPPLAPPGTGAGAHSARSRGAGSGLAQVVLVLRPGADLRHARVASGYVERRAVPGAHGRASRDRGPRRAAARAGSDGAAAATHPARPRARVA